MLRRTFTAGAVALAAAAMPPVALAQTKTTRIVVSFPPGGPVDFVARALAEQLGKELGHTVIVDNKAGANGAIGASDVARSPADGSSLWLTSVGAAAINASLYEKVAYDMTRDFAPVSLVVNNVELLVVNPADPAKDAVVGYRQHPAPGDRATRRRQRREPSARSLQGCGTGDH
jgi:tripartite-type tricarboxylate transporter receptor subunit TctC